MLSKKNLYQIIVLELFDKVKVEIIFSEKGIDLKLLEKM